MKDRSVAEICVAIKDNRVAEKNAAMMVKRVVIINSVVTKDSHVVGIHAAMMIKRVVIINFVAIKNMRVVETNAAIKDRNVAGIHAVSWDKHVSMDLVVRLKINVWILLPTNKNVVQETIKNVT